MSKLTPEEFAEKQARNLKNSVSDIARGIDKVTEAPTKLAAQKIDKMRQKWNEAMDSGIIKARLEKVTLEQWKDKAKNVGVQRISSGIDAAKDKVVDFANQFLPYLDNVKAKVDKMPDLTLQDSINKMVTQVTEVSKFRKK